MRGVIRILLAIAPLCFGSMPAYAHGGGPDRAQHHEPDCADVEHAAKHGYRHHRRHIGKGCRQENRFELAVTLDGSGSGRVSSKPPGIYCQTDCSQTYRKNRRIRLRAEPYSGSLFTGWSGACTGSGPCQIRLQADTAVGANFARIEPAPLSLVTPYLNENDMREINDYFNAQYDSLPWGRIHDGLDIDPGGNLKPYRSACAGRVRKIYGFDDQVMLIIDCDATYSVGYNFEAQAPGTGQIQLDNIRVSEGQAVAQGQVIGYLYSAEKPDRAHVHFTLYQDAAPVCPAPFFTPAASASILNLLAVVHSDGVMCRSGNVPPPPLATPYVDAADMARIAAGYSAAHGVSPWGYPHDGLDIYPRDDLAPLQAACAGAIDTLELRQDSVSGKWQVEVAVVCDDYVYDPDAGGYFIPLTTKYVLKTMSRQPQAGQAQLDNILVAPGESVAQGTVIGYLKRANRKSHLHFELQQFGQSEFEVFGVTGIPRCPQGRFSAAARDSVLALLRAAWPGAEMCYQ